MLGRFFTLIRAWINNLLGKVEDPQVMLEQTYNELQNNLIQVRQAVAQAIATEKQLEQQLQKNKDQVATWVNRAGMAVQQNNDDLARQALERKQQYTAAVTELETQLAAQKGATAGLRERLTELETKVQQTYTKKQVLIARDKAAIATTKANEILSKTTADGALTIMDRMEQKINERETQAAALSDLGADTLDNKFKSFEGQSSIEAELAALKGQVRGGNAKSITANNQSVSIKVSDPGEVEDVEVREVKNQQ